MNPLRRLRESRINDLTEQIAYLKRELASARAARDVAQMQYEQEQADHRATAAEYLAKFDRMSAEFAKVDKAYDLIGDRLVKSEAKLVGREAWIRRAVAELKTSLWFIPSVNPVAERVNDLLDTAPLVGEAPVKPVSEKYR